MTKTTRPVVRETDATIYSLGQSRPIVTTIHRGGQTLGFRLKGQRQAYLLPTEWCFWQAVEAHIKTEQRRKKAARKGKRHA